MNVCAVAIDAPLRESAFGVSTSLFWGLFYGEC
jgi:hypothetical protein